MKNCKWTWQVHRPAIDTLLHQTLWVQSLIDSYRDSKFPQSYKQMKHEGTQKGGVHFFQNMMKDEKKKEEIDVAYI